MSAPFLPSYHNSDSGDVVGFAALGRDDDGVEVTEYSTKDAIILLVDCSSSMFNSLVPDDSLDSKMDEEGTEANRFSTVLNVIVDHLKYKIICSRDDLVGVVFYNTAKTENANGFEHIYAYRNIDEADASLIKGVKSLLDPEELEEELGGPSDTPAEFHKVLWVCSTMFGDSALKKVSKRIFVFTDQDDPTGGDEELQRLAIQKGNDLEELDIEMELFPLKPNFDARSFYMHLIRIPADEDIGAFGLNFTGKLESLRDELRKKEFKKRALASVPFELGNGVKVGVRLYCLVRSAEKDFAVQVDAKTGEKLECLTQWVCASSGSFCQDHEFETYFPYAGREVPFTKDEMGRIKDFGPPGLTLMGFKNLNRLKPYHNIKNSYFMYPDDTSIEGSTVAFVALMGEMLKMGKFAVARLIYRRRTIPKLVALVPQPEVVDDMGGQVQPPGFHVIFLPYADDIRAIEFDTTNHVVAGPELVLKAKQVIKSMRLNWVPSKIENPALQKHYAALQANAIDEELDEDLDDDLLPMEAALESGEKWIQAFKEDAFEGEMEEEEQEEKAVSKSPTKRKRGGGDYDGDSSSNTATKKTSTKKVKATLSPDEIEEYKERYEDGTLKKFTVADLKHFLSGVSQPVSGKKADLIQRVEKYFKDK